MKVYMDERDLAYFEALASQTRLQIIKLLSERDMNIKELAQALDISSSIMTKHIRKLESARLITTANKSKDGSRQKVCSLVNTVTEVCMPPAEDPYNGEARYYHSSLPVGQYTMIQASAPCGIAGESNVLGGIDQPAHLFIPERMDAQLLWLDSGFVEYTAPNFLVDEQRPTAVEISGEFGSQTAAEPSQISVYINEQPMCNFYAIGAQKAGQWPFNQYGVLAVIRVTDDGVYVNGEKKSSATIDNIDYNYDYWTIRFEVNESGETVGGLSVFGERLGVNKQNIEMKVYYE